MKVRRPLTTFGALKPGTKVCRKEAYDTLKSEFVAEGAIKSITVEAGSIRTVEVLWPSGRITEESFYRLLEIYEDDSNNPNLTFKAEKDINHV